MTRRVRQGVLLAGAMFCGLVTAVHAETVEEAQQRIAEQWNRLHSLTADLTLGADTESELDATINRVNSTGHFEMIRKDDKTLTRLELEGRTESGSKDTPEQKARRMTMIGDGEFVYQLQEVDGEQRAAKAKHNPSQVMQIGGMAVFEAVKDQYEFKLLPPEELDGVPCYVFEASGEGKDHTRKYYFDRETGVMRKMIVISSAGDVTFTIRVDRIEVNPKLSEERFVFVAPDGVELHDATSGRSRVKINKPGD